MLEHRGQCVAVLFQQIALNRHTADAQVEEMNTSL